MLARRRARTDAPAAAAHRTDRSPAQPQPSAPPQARLHRPPRPQAAAAPPPAQDRLPRHPEMLREHRAQALVPLDQIAQRAFQRRAIEPPRKPHRKRDHIGAAAAGCRLGCRRRPPAAPGTTAAAAHRTAGSRPDAAPPQAAHARARSADDSRSDSAATLGASNRLRIATSTSSAARIRLIRRVANSECPPSSKKLSSTPTRGSPSTSANSPHSSASCGLRGARCTAPGRKLRRRQRTAVQLAVRRQRQTLQHHDRRRHHVLRQHPRQRSPKQSRLRHHSRPRSPNHIADQPRPPAPSSRATTTACDTPACRSSTASISPGSIRNPRSFTCASARPRNSSTPSARHRARSPVRYIREPAPPQRRAVRVRHKPLRRQTRTIADSPAPDPTPAMYSSPTTPARNRLKTSIQNIGPRVPDRTANRHLGRAVASSRPSASRRSRLRSDRTGSPAEPAAEAWPPDRASSAGSASPLQMMRRSSGKDAARASAAADLPSDTAIRHVVLDLDPRPRAR